MPQKDFVKQCYQQSIALLKRNSTRYGVMAAAPSPEANRKNYIHIFGRDASICALGMVASGDHELIRNARRSLHTLARYQTELGQIPNSLDPKKNEVLFWHLGCIDATLWWLIAVDFFNRTVKDKVFEKKLKPYVNKAIQWLFYQDTNNCGLLEQGEAVGWDDDMPVNGITLYTNVLWFRVLDRYGCRSAARLTLDGINNLMMPHEAKFNTSQYLKRDPIRKIQLEIIKNYVKPRPYFLHYVSYRYASDRCDVYANLLSILFDVAAPARAKAIMHYLRQSQISKKYPVKVLLPPIVNKDNDWHDYMYGHEGSVNKPHLYHNGGMWPYIGGFWVMALHKLGQKRLAREELVKLALANKVNNWEFNEWFHGQTGKPMGIPHQSWNAGMFLLAYHNLKK